MKNKKGRISEEDKGIIKQMKNKGADISVIAQSVRRTERAVSNFLKKFDNNMAPKKMPKPAKKKTQFFHGKGATVMQESESMRSDEAKGRVRNPDKPKKPVSIHKIHE